MSQEVQEAMTAAEQTLTKTISAYCLALEEQRQRNAHYLKEVGDQWRTPDLLFWGINAMFGPLVLDLFADDSNTKCPAWYTAEDNALTQDWSGRLVELGGAAFANPPYSRSQYHEKQAITGMTHIMNYTAEQREKGGRYIYLVKSATSETWWPEYADHIMFIRGRIGFDLPTWFVPADEKQKPTSAFFAGAIAVYGFKVLFPSGNGFLFRAEVRQHTWDSQTNGVVAATFSLRLKGKPSNIDSTGILSFINDLSPSLSVAAGSALTMGVVIQGGTAPYTYIWKKGSSTVSGQTSATFNKASAVSGDAGVYSCVVTDSATPANVITSSDCTVTIS